MDWYRWHNRTVEDSKWRAVARRTGLPVHAVVAVWAALCENANQSPERGTLANWCGEDVAAALDLEPEQVAAVLEAMQGKVMEGERLTGWEKRNPKREDPTAPDRQRRKRARHAESRNVTPVTQTEREEERELEVEKETTSSVLKLLAGATQDVDGQVNEIIRSANRGMIDNPAIGSLANPIPVSHGSREDVREWLDQAPFAVVQVAVYERAKAYKPDGRRRQITTMAYFTGAVQDAAERWRAQQTRVTNERSEERPVGGGAATPVAGAPGKRDRFRHLEVDGSAA